MLTFSVRILGSQSGEVVLETEVGELSALSEAGLKSDDQDEPHNGRPISAVSSAHSWPPTLGTADLDYTGLDTVMQSQTITDIIARLDKHYYLTRNIYNLIDFQLLF